MTISPGTVTSSFAQVAREFCAWCEGPSLGAGAEAQAASWLCKLYAAALALPKVCPDNDDGLPSLSPHQLDRATVNLKHFGGRYYRECFDPDPKANDEPVIGDIGDDLLDTYKDIAAGLLLLEQGKTNEALWHWSVRAD